MKSFALWAGPILGVAVGWWVSQTGLGNAAAWTAGITFLTALWWVFEPIPIPATSLIPIAVLPLVGVLTARQVGAAYGNEMILLLTGGFMLSKAMERSGTHRRIALGMVHVLGGESAHRLVLGFLVASAVLSMWISNSATALMLLPIVLAVLEKVTDSRLTIALLLAVAYGASIGGIGTPVGTPPNLIFMQNYEIQTGNEVSFVTWMGWALPIIVIMLPLVWLRLASGIRLSEKIALPDTGPWRVEERRTLAVFGVTALLWITRAEPWGGWSTFLNLPDASDASVALLAVVVMFLVPNGRGERLLNWDTAIRIPWGVLLLFSSGIVIADAFTKSGLSKVIGSQLAGLTAMPTPVMIGLLCLVVTFLTEVTSNTAIANLLMPILAGTAADVNMDCRVLMFPAAITASFAFMLPVATAPNAVVFSSDRVTVRQMASQGFALNLIGIIVVTAISTWLFAW
jgi:solute carrier family 13 (sodium-dependent dicarboxylate transporter), member 2/3/5